MYWAKQELCSLDVVAVSLHSLSLLITSQNSLGLECASAGHFLPRGPSEVAGSAGLAETEVAAEVYCCWYAYAVIQQFKAQTDDLQGRL